MNCEDTILVMRECLDVLADTSDAKNVLEIAAKTQTIEQLQTAREEQIKDSIRGNM